MKLAIGAPWYGGPDETTVYTYFDFMSYLGALRERTLWRDRIGKEAFGEVVGKMPPLGEGQFPLADPPDEEEWDRLGVLELYTIDRSRISLPGKARDLIVGDALELGADYLLWWDADMRFDLDAFLRLWRNQKLVCGALAFTARWPFIPVLYQIVTSYDAMAGMRKIEGSNLILDYSRDTLMTHEDLAFGAGMVLYDMQVFREVPEPWFSSTGCGEDWFFCYRCRESGIERWVDTSVKTKHKEHTAHWVDEERYWQERERSRDAYVAVAGGNVTQVKDGEVIA